jgi:AraC-like DNA-binding protein
VEESVAQSTRTGQPLSIVCKPAGTPHADRYGQQGASLLQIECNAAELLTPKLQWDWSHRGEFLRPFLSLALLLTDRCGESQLIAATKALLHSFQPVAQTRSVPLWLQRIRNTVVTSPDRGQIRVEDLAAQNGIHPVYLTRQFRRHFGETIRSCISRMRIQVAARVITEGDRKLADIAYDLGYADQAHFCREFRNHTGITPRELRHLAHP